LGKKNFHLAIGSLNAAGNDGAIFRIIRNLSSTSPTNNISWKSAEVDAAISKLRTASTDDQKKAGYKQVADAFMRDIPAVVLAAVPETIIWNSKVQGVVPTADSIVLLSRAWIAA
jgi:ABC-type oligopeptide transport system substrate-binding subunit